MTRKKARTVLPPSENRGGNNKAADQPGYFLSLTVRNVRCFGDQEQTLDLSDGKGGHVPWSILLGNNGTGKTTLLQTLALAATGVDPERSIVEQPLRESFDRVLRRLLPPYSPLLRASGENQASGRATLVFRSPGGNPRTIEQGVFQEWTGSGILTLGFKQPPSPIPPSHLPVCFGYGAGRRMGGGPLTFDWRADTTIGLFTDETPLRNAEEWLSQLDWAAGQESRVQKRQRKRLEQVKELLVRVLPDVTGIRRTAPQKESDRPRFEFQTPYGWVQLRQLGYGYQTMIGWMVDFASRMVDRYPDSPDPLAEPAVVLVDEIDLHLHPRWQRELMGYLSDRFPNTQFIATAHSPLIVQAAPSVNANIAVLRREGDHVVIDNKPESIRGWRVDQILTSDIYDLPTARPKEFDEAIQRRVTLLSKPQLTPKDRRELRKLDKQLEALPAGETASEAREMMDLARDTLDLLKKHQSRRR